MIGGVCKLKKRKFQIDLKYITTLLVIPFFFTEFAFAEGNQSKAFAKAWNSLFNEYSIFVSGFIGFSLLTSILVFIVHLIKLGSEGNANPIIRAKIFKDILISGITTALLGCIGVIYVILYQTSWGN